MVLSEMMLYISAICQVANSYQMFGFQFLLEHPSFSITYTSKRQSSDWTYQDNQFLFFLINESIKVPVYQQQDLILAKLGKIYVITLKQKLCYYKHSMDRATSLINRILTGG